MIVPATWQNNTKRAVRSTLSHLKNAGKILRADKIVSAKTHKPVEFGIEKAECEFRK
jgi:hypothetical protein